MASYLSFSGVITMIHDFGTGTDQGDGCYKLVAVDNHQGMSVNFVVEPTTYFVDHFMMRIGDRVTGFYDANVTVPLISPPQYLAVVIDADSPLIPVKVDFISDILSSSE